MMEPESVTVCAFEWLFLKIRVLAQVHAALIRLQRIFLKKTVKGDKNSTYTPLLVHLPPQIDLPRRRSLHRRFRRLRLYNRRHLC